MDEIWKTIPGWESYEVSDAGRIRSVDRVIYENPTNKARKLRGKLMTPRYDQHGYLQVQIKHNGKRKVMKIHRAVAMAFIPNLDNKPCVNHIDNDPSNNHVENLEWVTMKENSQWMLKQGRADRDEQWIGRLKESLKWKNKAVIGTNIQTGEEIYYPRVNDVKKDGFIPGSVSQNCRGIKYKTHKGYVWRYANAEHHPE